MFNNFAVFMKRPWFRRIWVVQELAVARQVIVVCGERERTWDVFERYEVRLRAGGLPTIWQGDIELLDASNCLLNMHRIRRKRTETSEDKRQPSLLEIMNATADYHYTDPHDRVYTLIGLAPPSEQAAVVVDYNLPLEVVYSALAKHLFSTDQAFACLSLAQKSGTRPHMLLPSWVPTSSAERSDVPSNILGYGIIHDAATAEGSSVVISEDGNSLLITRYRYCGVGGLCEEVLEMTSLLKMADYVQAWEVLRAMLKLA